MSDTFWKGYRRDDVELLAGDIPPSGKVKDKNRPMLEEFRKFQNAYYRLRNDGDSPYSKLRHMAKRFNVEWPSYGSEGSLELLGDKVIDAALKEKRGHDNVVT
jgi:hypothetical protein